MSLDDEQTQVSITAYEAALNLFTDRIQERRLFASYLNDDPPRKQVLFFHGDGGNGKSWLLRILRERYCKRLPPESWAYVREQEDGKAFIAHFEEAEYFSPVPCAYLDFADINHDNPPKDAFHGPRLLRKQLGRQGLGFPLYDFALLLYWIKGRGESRASAKTLFPAEEAEFVDKLLNCVYESKTVERVSAVLKLFDAHFGDRFGLYLKRRKLEEAEWRRLESLDANAQLYFELPRLFALDLNAALANGDDRRSGLQPATAPSHRGLKPAPTGREDSKNRPPRIVLLFDTHEAFWGVGRAHESTASYFQADEWLRRLLRALDLDKGIVAVVAGREPPRWADAPINPQDGKATALPLSHLDTQLVGHLEPEDADEYLQKAGVADAGLRQALVRQAEVPPGQVHPLYVGLCGDIALLAAQQGQPLDPASFATAPADPAKALVERLLRYCPADLANAVKALAAARAFDRELFFALGEKLHYHATAASYQSLMGFSFVWPSKKGEGWGRIHDLLRRVLWEIDEEQTALADAVLEDWFRTRHAAGDETAIVEAIYHANRREWLRGCNEWCSVSEFALGYSHRALSESLLELHPELSLKANSAYGVAAFCAGRLNQALSHHQAARSYFEKALGWYKKALKADPNDIGLLINKGLALYELARLLNHNEAKNAYRLALKAYDEYLRVNPDFPPAFCNRGTTLLGLAGLISEHKEKQKIYYQAIDAYSKALQLDPNYLYAYNNQGAALCSLAELLAGKAEYAKARDVYQEAIGAYNNALRLTSDYPHAYNNHGNVLREMADMLVELAEYSEAQNTYRHAIDSFEHALRLAPDYINAHLNKGRALTELANLLVDLGGNEKAEEIYGQAIAAYDVPLRLVPDNAGIQQHLGNTLLGLGNFLASLGEHGEEARKTYQQALNSYRESNRLLPDSFYIHNNIGGVLIGLGDLQASVDKDEEAGEHYRQAVDAFGEVLRRMPNDLNANMNQGSALLKLADIVALSPEYSQAREIYQKAIDAYDKASKFAKDFVPLNRNRGMALNHWTELLICLDEFNEAKQKNKQARDNCCRALALAPNNLSIMKTLAEAQLLAARLETLTQGTGTPALLQAALDTLEQALAIVPDHPQLLQLRQQVQDALREERDQQGGISSCM